MIDWSVSRVEIHKLKITDGWLVIQVDRIYYSILQAHIYKVTDPLGSQM